MIRPLRILDLCSGLDGWTRVWPEGTQIVSIDHDPSFNATLTADIRDVDVGIVASLFGGYLPDVVLASPPCTCFSVASIGRHWFGDRNSKAPKSEAAVEAIEIVTHIRDLIIATGARYWVMENPRGVLRKLPVVADLFRTTISYCRYGESRMKPTDIWMSEKMFEIWTPRPMCHNGNPDHDYAPRGSRTGTQGLKNAALRSLIPLELAEEIRDVILSDSNKE